MSRRKDRERSQAAADWMAMTPGEHLDQAADIWGVIIGAPVTGDRERLAALTHAQTHLLAGLLKLQLAGSGTAEQQGA